VEHVSATRNEAYDEKFRKGLEEIIIRCLDKELRSLEPLIQRQSNSTIPELMDSSGSGKTTLNSSHLFRTADSDVSSAWTQEFTQGGLDSSGVLSPAQFEDTPQWTRQTGSTTRLQHFWWIVISNKHRLHHTTTLKPESKPASAHRHTQNWQRERHLTFLDPQFQNFKTR